MPPWPKSRPPDTLTPPSTLAALLSRDATRIATALGLPREEAFGEARILMAQALGRSRAWLMAHDRDAIDPLDAQLALYTRWTDRRVEGEPVAYVLGWREFYGRDFEVGPAVLIPRPETELLVRTVLDHLPAARACRVLDLGTGSGCVALTIASEASMSRVLATDASSDALGQAMRNAQALAVDNADFLLSDWFSELDGLGFDVIVSNPPYVAEGDPHLRQGDLRHEPQRALTPGATGMEAIEQIVEGAPRHLKPDGWLMLEHGHAQGESVRRLLTESGFTSITTASDLAGLDRVTLGQWSEVD